MCVPPDEPKRAKPRPPISFLFLFVGEASRSTHPISFSSLRRGPKAPSRDPRYVGSVALHQAARPQRERAAGERHTEDVWATLDPRHVASEGASFSTYGVDPANLSRKVRGERGSPRTWGGG